jgi:type II secretory pathway pseudopilin PulG
MSNAFLRPSGRRALTLVEVIAGLVLLATLLTTVLTAFKTHAAQIRGARDRLNAARAADELITSWMAQGALPPVGTQKPLAEIEGCSWRLLANESQATEPLKITTVRLEIVRPRLLAEDEVLASVALVVSGNSLIAK